ncbi:glutamate--cysteine ligase [Algimonas porphyrae]|uniref:Glutamate--cysteine ligase n=1 Tax=Algimonas porphyrae TaxID=1128113 RepID=A0ABQ5UYP6_9PROT|nr:glutamate--cysteine ligase [Algimonas porphyrae]GLQ20034.1 glutamate--cysteine ligase [Algimonas porphyrae]
MSGPSTPNPILIESKAQLAAHLARGCKPNADWRIGTEHEKIAFATADNRPLPYDGETSIRALLEGLQRFDWEPYEENGHLVALKRDGASVSLEPGGQFELSGAPLEHVHQTCAEVTRHLREVREVADEIGAGFLSLGFRPDTKLEDVPVMPKGRYKIMRDYMQTVGTLGREMMFRTCTVQTNLDFSSEADMVKKFRVSLALQPVATTLFANSPFTDGKLNGFKSYRSRVWMDTDADRTGMLPWVFDDGMGFERYVDYALDVPMYFVQRDGRFLDASGKSFRDFMNGTLDVVPGEIPTLSDFDDHLSTIFPEVRLKQFLEMRGADTGPWDELCALPAFWVGLLYDDQALDEAWDLVKNWTAEQRQTLREDVPAQGFEAVIGGRSVRDLALESLSLSRGGLNRRAYLNGHGENETVFLQALDAMARSGQSNADLLIKAYESDWNGDISRCYTDCIY